MKNKVNIGCEKKKSRTFQADLSHHQHYCILNVFLGYQLWCTGYILHCVYQFVFYSPVLRWQNSTCQGDKTLYFTQLLVSHDYTHLVCNKDNILFCKCFLKELPILRNTILINLLFCILHSFVPPFSWIKSQNKNLKPIKN